MTRFLLYENGRQPGKTGTFFRTKHFNLYHPMENIHCRFSNCKRGCTVKCWAEVNNSYCPSNGTEGASFLEEYCMNCLHCDPDPDGKKQCEIMLATMCFYPNHPEYPKEWTHDALGHPICTKHVHWDWGTNGDPDDPDNPNKPPDPPDPNQLHLFPLYPSEVTYEHTETHTPIASL